MAVDEKLLARARQNPAGLGSTEAMNLARQLGWKEVRIRGSHHILHHPLAPKIRDRYPQPLNLQEGKDGKAREYQIRPMLQMASEMGVISKAE